MNLKTLFVIAAFVTIVSGVLFIIIPNHIYALYGIKADMQVNYMGSLYGAALIAIGLIAWQVKNAVDSNAREAIVLSFFIAELIGFIIALFAQLHNVVNSLGWMTVAVYFFFTVSFGYYSFFNAEGGGS